MSTKTSECLPCSDLTGSLKSLSLQSFPEANPCPTLSSFSPPPSLRSLSSFSLPLHPLGVSCTRRRRRGQREEDKKGEERVLSFWDPAHHPSRMPHPSYRSSFSEREQTWPQCAHCVLTPAAWRPSPSLRGSSCLLTGHFLINVIPLILKRVVAEASGRYNPHRKGLSWASHSSVLLNILRESLGITPVVVSCLDWPDPALCPQLCHYDLM